MTAVLLVAAAVAAVADWWAVERENPRVEYVAKPATTLLLLGAALALHPACRGERIAVVAALALCLAGDVFLMLPSDQFVAGLASFLVGHVLFIVGFVLGRGHDPLWGFTIAAALVALAISARPVLQGAVAGDARLRIPVLAYMTVIGVMLAASALPANRLAIAGAATFVLSDSILARNRFVAPISHGRLATMVTYHAALALIVVSLV
jgi:uncharacterized membrane protein YhhN